MSQTADALVHRGLVHNGFLRCAADDPNRIAVHTESGTVSFGDLGKRCAALAVDLESRGATRVGLCQHNSVTVIEVFFATLMSGGHVCLFDPSWPTDVLHKLVEIHKPDVLVAPSPTLMVLSNILSKGQGLSAEDIETVRTGRDGQETFTVQPKPDTPFLLGFTSGTSGLPKAFIRSHCTWVESFRQSAIELGTCAEDTVMAPGPLSHGLSLYAAIEALCAGASVVIQTEFDAGEVLHSIGARDATVLVAVPAMLDAVVAHARGKVYASVTRVITAGAKLSPQLRSDTMAVFPNADTVEYYGASELSFLTVAKGSEDCPPDSVGRPFAGTEIAVKGDAGATVTPGEVGIIWVKSEMISSGYVGPTDGSGFRTDEAWATVGDLGHLDENGFLYLDGREGKVLTSAGYTVYPSAIEKGLLTHPDVAEVVVLGLPHDRWGEIIAAVVLAKPERTPTEDVLAEHCKAHMEPYACPRRWQFVESFERTSSGKIKLTGLAELFD